MAYEFQYFQGKAKWVKIHQPDGYGNWKLDLYLNPESLNKLTELKTNKDGVSGILNTIKEDEDGKFTTFKRPQQKMMKGKVVGFAPPEVLMADGTTPLRDQMIGNGSDVTVKVQIYTYNKPGGGKGKATRLESIRVDNLIPFNPRQDFDGDQQKLVKGLEEQPEQLF